MEAHGVPTTRAEEDVELPESAVQVLEMMQRDYLLPESCASEMTELLKDHMRNKVRSATSCRPFAYMRVFVFACVFVLAVVFAAQAGGRAFRSEYLGRRARIPHI